MAGFSTGVKLVDSELDYLAPSQACILPPAETGGHVKRYEKGEKPVEEAVKITLADCLACSGCVTSAETMLVQEQSSGKLLSILKEAGRSVHPEVLKLLPTDLPEGMAVDGGETPLPEKVLVSLSPQSVASVAAYYNTTPSDTFARLHAFFTECVGCDDVVDVMWAQAISVTETTLDFAAKLEDDSFAKPVIASACPGVVCYAEKSETKLVPHLTTAQSAQQVFGSIAKEYYSKQWGVPPSKILHISIQPCYDKKLEAARREFTTDDGAKYCDLVLASHEVLDMLKCVHTPETWNAVDVVGWKWSSLFGKSLMRVDDPEGTNEGAEGQEGSGAYYQVAFQYVAKKRYGIDVSRRELLRGCSKEGYEVKVEKERQGRTEVTLVVGGKAVLRVAACYGFKNLRNLVRGTRIRQPPYKSFDFIELMACPSGCVNGGGQIRAEQQLSPETNASLVTRVQEAFHGLLSDCYDRPYLSIDGLLSDSPSTTSQPLTVSKAYQEVVGGGPYSEKSRKRLHTTYQAVAKLESSSSAPATISW